MANKSTFTCHIWTPQKVVEPGAAAEFRAVRKDGLSVQLLAMLIGAHQAAARPLSSTVGSWVRSVCRRLEASMGYDGFHLHRSPNASSRRRTLEQFLHG
jgi:hypothetical protein